MTTQSKTVISENIILLTALEEAFLRDKSTYSSIVVPAMVNNNHITTNSKTVISKNTIANWADTEVEEVFLKFESTYSIPLPCIINNNHMTPHIKTVVSEDSILPSAMTRR